MPGVGSDYSVRPAYVALAKVSRAIEGRPFLRRLLHPDEAVRLYLFGPPEDPLPAAWTAEVTPAELVAGRPNDGRPLRTRALAGGALQRSRTVMLQLGAQAVCVVDWQGRERTVAVPGHPLRLGLSTWPQYPSGLGVVSPAGMRSRAVKTGHAHRDRVPATQD